MFSIFRLANGIFGMRRMRATRVACSLFRCSLELDMEHAKRYVKYASHFCFLWVLRHISDELVLHGDMAINKCLPYVASDVFYGHVLFILFHGREFIQKHADTAWGKRWIWLVLTSFILFDIFASLPFSLFSPYTSFYLTSNEVFRRRWIVWLKWGVKAFSQTNTRKINILLCGHRIGCFGKLTGSNQQQPAATTAPSSTS